MEKQQSAKKDSAQKPEDILVVGIGASAGGLEAIQAFFEKVPLKTGLAFVLVQHLSPDYKSLMDELLARYTKLSIKKVENETPLTPDTIFLIPPRKNMTISKGKLYLNEQELRKGSNLPIDAFFCSLAKDKEKKAIAIVLSGTGSDGTAGIRAIKNNSGMIMVQDKATAKFDGMPLSSIATGMVDFILPPEKMPEVLLKYLQHPFENKDLTLEDQLNRHTDALSKIFVVLENFTEIDFSQYRKDLVLEKIERRMKIKNINTLDGYVDFLARSEEEVTTVYREILLGVTSFFRDPSSFVALQQKVLPKLFASPATTFRFWVIGCATGEEAYSLAIILSEFVEKNSLKHEFKIFATDIDQDALNTAANAIYPQNIVSDIMPEYLGKYFQRKQNTYQVNQKLRKTVVFARHDVLNDPPFSRINLISCRNLLSLFAPKTRERMLSLFSFSLRNNGFLFLGDKENLKKSRSDFSMLDANYPLYQQHTKKTAQAQNMHLPTVTRYEVEHEKTGGYHRRQIAERNTEEIISKKINSIFTPPSVVIDRHAKIVHIINDVSSFLRVPRGAFSEDFFSFLPDQLKGIVRNILRRLQRKESKIFYENITNIEGLEKRIFDIQGYALWAKPQEEKLYLFSFIDKKEKSKNAPTYDYSQQPPQHHDEYLQDLERELQSTRQNLQATVEELESSNQELQSSNEELVASNEELQSTNQELQSVNEELYTVNSEYQNKIQELTQLNNDINNLLENTEIGMLYLDQKLEVRKFTPIAAQITRLIQLDVGRPIKHLDLSHVHKNFIRNIEKVHQTLQTKECEIQIANKEWVLIKIMPYRTEHDKVEGVSVTFVNITHLKKLEKREARLSRRLKMALRIGQMAWWEWTPQSGKLNFDQELPRMLGYEPEQFPDTSTEISNFFPRKDWQQIKKAMIDHLKRRNSFFEVTYQIRTKNGNLRWHLNKGGAISQEKDGKAKQMIGIVVDITAQKQIEAEVIRQREFLHKVLENSPIAKTQVDKNGQILFANQKAKQLLGFTQKQISERSFDDIKWKITDIHHKPIPPEKLPFSQIKKTQRSLRDFRHYVEKSSGEKILLSINGSPMFDQQGEFEGVVFAMRDITAENKAQIALIKSEKKYKSLFEANLDAILIADTNRNIVDANPAFEKLFGYSLQEVKGKKTSDLYAQKEQYAKVGKKIKTGSNENTPFTEIISYQKKDGQVFAGGTHIFSLKTKQGETYAFVGIIRELQDAEYNFKS